MAYPPNQCSPSHRSVVLADEQATVALGLALGRAAKAGGVVFLEGTLGAGKTSLCRGVLRAFGYQGAVKSPTYTLVEAYQFDNQQVYHFDLYRLGDPEELEYVGIRDYFSPTNLCLIEWPERGRGFLPAADLEVKVKVISIAEKKQSIRVTQRKVEINARTAVGEEICNRLQVP